MPSSAGDFSFSAAMLIRELRLMYSKRDLFKGTAPSECTEASR